MTEINKIKWHNHPVQNKGYWMGAWDAIGKVEGKPCPICKDEVKK